MNTALVIAKEVAKAASSYGIGYMGGEICKVLTPENAKTFTKVCIYIGSGAAAGYVSYKAGSYIDDTAKAIDDTAKAIKEVINEKKSTKKEEVPEEKEEEKKETPKKKGAKKPKVEKTEEA